MSAITPVSIIAAGLLAAASAQACLPDIKSVRKVAGTEWVTRVHNAETYGGAGLRVSDYWVTYADGQMMLVTAKDRGQAKAFANTAMSRMGVLEAA